MSDFLKRMIEEAEAGWDWDAELQELAKVTPTEDHAVKRDMFDKMTYGGMLASVEKLVEEIDRIGKDFEQAPPAFEDLFNLLYQGDPRFVDAEKMLPEYLANHDLIRQLFDSEEFKILRADTMYDDYSAVFALLTMEEDIRKAFERVAEKREQQKQAAERQAEAEQRLQDAMQQAQDAEGHGQGMGDAAQALQDAMGAAQAAQQAAQQAGQQHQQAANDAVTGMANAASQAKQDMDAEKQLMRGLGCGSEDGELQRMPFNERRALMERAKNGRLAKFAKMIGATREFADAERRRKVKHAPAEVHEYETGNDLTRLVPTEMQALAIPELEEQFWLRYARHELLLKKTKGPKKLGQGPVIVVCDESYSMVEKVDAEGNTREAWSKALSLALSDQAKRGNRDFHYIGFGNASQQVQIDFPGGRTPLEKVLEFTEHFFAGGTSYERPLTMALEQVEKALAEGKDRPDIVFLTDDECAVPPEFVKSFAAVRTKADAKVYGIQIGRGTIDNAMRSLCDRVIPIANLVTLPEGVKDLFRQI